MGVYFFRHCMLASCPRPTHFRIIQHLAPNAVDLYSSSPKLSKTNPPTHLLLRPITSATSRLPPTAAASAAMVKDWCNKGSTWDNTLAAMKGRKKLSKKENNDLIDLMLGVGIDTPTVPEPTKTRLSKEAVEECIAAVNATTVIPHPTADDQPKCVACKTAVALHMEVPTNLIKGKRYELDYCNACMLVTEVNGKIFIDNPASCGCPATRFRTCLDCKFCYTKKKAKDRTGAMCNRGCGVDLGIGQHLLGTTKEWMILSKFTCSKCTERSCAVEGCNTYSWAGCSGHCLVAAVPKNLLETQPTTDIQIKPCHNSIFSCFFSTFFSEKVRSRFHI